jgi:hypothetical protein
MDTKYTHGNNTTDIELLHMCNVIKSSNLSSETETGSHAATKDE